MLQLMSPTWWRDWWTTRADTSPMAASRCRATASRRRSTARCPRRRSNLEAAYRGTHHRSAPSDIHGSVGRNSRTDAVTIGMPARNGRRNGSRALSNGSRSHDGAGGGGDPVNRRVTTRRVAVPLTMHAAVTTAADRNRPVVSTVIGYEPEKTHTWTTKPAANPPVIVDAVTTVHDTARHTPAAPVRPPVPWR
jgi:hypothetical protein